ncbi:MAG: hypothetical protein ACLPYS_04110 [Vulcanimicrobiaceae bacterium]|jgi:hypothetical protein
MIGKASLAALALALGTSDATPSLVPDFNASKFTYRSAFEGSLWDGQHVSQGGTFDLVRLDARTVRVEEEGGESAVARYDGALLSLDRSTSEALGSAVGYVNQFAAPVLAHGSFQPGDSWTARLPVYLGGGAPLEGDAKVTVVSVDGDRVMLQATASLSGTSTYGAYTTPIDLSLRLAERFARGTLVRGDAAVSEVVHAAGQEQTLRWTMSLAQQ